MSVGEIPSPCGVAAGSGRLGEATFIGVVFGSWAAICAGEGVGMFVGVGVLPMTIGFEGSAPFFAVTFLGGGRAGGFRC